MARSLVGTRIRERRRAKKLSQTSLAAKAGISTSYMNLIEHNHRGIAGRTLLAIAEGLDVDPRELSEGADQMLITRLQEASALEGETTAELDRIEEFVGRFPGWAQLNASLFENIQSQDKRLQLLSDRLGRDPFFSEAMHLMLSNVTVLQSTSDILNSFEDIPADQRGRFLQNMKNESEQLADTIVKLLAYFDETGAADTAKQATRMKSSLDAFWESHQYHVPEIEELDNFTSSDFETLERSWNFVSAGEQEDAERALTRYHSIAKALPAEAFMSSARKHGYNPVSLAQEFDRPVHDIFFRLAHLPHSGDTPEFGLIECDGSGGVLFRKPLKTLSLPHKSSACPLWPLYRAISQPMQPFRNIMETPTGDSFLTHSYSIWREQGDYNMPATVKSAMLFTADYQSFTPPNERRALSNFKVGLTCEVCPRTACTSRRAESLIRS